MSDKEEEVKSKSESDDYDSTIIIIKSGTTQNI